MLGYFEAVDKNNKSLGFYKYSTVSECQKKTLLKLQTNNEVRFFCSCVPDRQIEMKISKDLKIYPALNGIGDQHSEFCVKRIREQEPKLWEIRHDAESKLWYNVASPSATAEHFAKKLNRLTVERLTYPEMRLPDNLLDFNKRLFITQKYIKTYNGKSLYELSLSNHKDLQSLPSNQEYFFYGTLSAAKTTNFNKNILYLDCKNTIGKKYRFYLEKEIFIEQFNNTRGLNWAICGFVYKKVDKSAILTFSDCYLGIIDKVGIFYT